MNYSFSIPFILCAWFIALSCFDVASIRKTKKHDDMLFPFFDLQRDIMKFLFKTTWEKSVTLTREEFLFVRELLRAVDIAAGDYNQHKISVFNMQEMAKHIEAYQRTATLGLEVPDNPKIRELHERFGRLLVSAFIAYSPLIRSRLALRLLAYANRAAKTVGAHRAIEYVVNNAEKVRNDARHYGLIEGGAVV